MTLEPVMDQDTSDNARDIRIFGDNLSTKTPLSVKVV
jgi:hypothetical protein